MKEQKKVVYVASCMRCPFMIRSQVHHEGGSGTPTYTIPSLFCVAGKNKLIVNPETKPSFCPLPISVRYGRGKAKGKADE